MEIASLKQTIREHRGFFEPETTGQWVRVSLVCGVAIGFVTGLFFGGSALGSRLAAESLRLGLRNALFDKLGEAFLLSAKQGAFIGGGLGALTASWCLYMDRNHTLCNNLKIRQAACEAAKAGLSAAQIKGDDDLDRLAKEMLERATPERLVRDLHDAVRAESRSVWRKSAPVRGLAAAALVGLISAYLVAIVKVGDSLARGVNPFLNLKYAAIAGGVVGAVGGTVSFCCQPEPLKTVVEVLQAKALFRKRGLSASELNQAITALYRQIPAEKTYESLVRQLANS